MAAARIAASARLIVTGVPGMTAPTKLPSPCALILRGPQSDRCQALDEISNRTQQPADRHVGEQPHDNQGQQRAQIAGADTGEIAAGAAAGEDHAVAEHQAAQDMAEPIQVRAQVHRFRQRDDAYRIEQLRADDGGRAGQHPSSEAAIVAERHDVGDRAHRAEIGSETM